VADEVTGITPPAPGGLAAYALGSIAGPDAGYPREQGYPQDPRYPPRPSSPPPSASPRPGHPGAAGYPEDPVHHQDRPSSDTPGGPPRGTRARRSGPVHGAQVAYVIVLAGVVAGLAYIWQGPHSVRAGTFILASAFFVAVVARLALPERRAGMLASRRRYIDVTALAILAIGLLVAGLVLPTPS
jgi:Protein of unknown function (DUF3017)